MVKPETVMGENLSQIGEICGFTRENCVLPLSTNIIMKTGGNIEMKFAAKISGFTVCAVILSIFCDIMVVMLVLVHTQLTTHTPHTPHPTQGVTIPSQRRWVQYYGHLIRNNLEYSPRTVLLKALRLQGMPTMQGGTCGGSLQ